MGFDWVSARLPEVQFERLRDRVRRDVDMRQKHPRHDMDYEFIEDEGDNRKNGFAVVALGDRSGTRREIAQVLFWKNRANGEITATPSSPYAGDKLTMKPEMQGRKARLTVVETGKSLKIWEISRLALGPLFSA